jgi:endonuclease YncB( thermonuclease family)
MRAFLLKVEFVALLGLSVLMLVLSALPARSAAPIVPRGQFFDCTPVSVWDGDGPVRCAEGPKVRLARIAAREIDGTCRPWHPCPKASGVAARDALVLLLGGARGTTADGHILVSGPRLRCYSDGNGKGDRTAAWCVFPDRSSLMAAMLRTGTVTKWR